MASEPDYSAVGVFSWLPCQQDMFYGRDVFHAWIIHHESINRLVELVVVNLSKMITEVWGTEI